MFRKILTGLVTAAGLTFASAAFAAPIHVAAPVATRTAERPTPRKVKLAKVKRQNKIALRRAVKPGPAKIQPRKFRTQMFRGSRRIARANVKPCVLRK